MTIFGWRCKPFITSQCNVNRMKNIHFNSFTVCIAPKGSCGKVIFSLVFVRPRGSAFPQYHGTGIPAPAPLECRSFSSQTVDVPQKADASSPLKADPPPDTVNRRAVHILLECVHVHHEFIAFSLFHNVMKKCHNTVVMGTIFLGNGIFAHVRGFVHFCFL